MEDSDTYDEEWCSVEEMDYDEHEVELDPLFDRCLEIERYFFRHWKRPLGAPRASAKNKKEKITRHFISVRAQMKEERRIASLPVPRPIPILSVNCVPTPAPTPTPTPTPSVYVSPTPVPVQTQNAYEKELQMAIQASLTQTHDSGLSFRQLNDLLNRDLTPEDYELLLLLDTTIAKKTTDDSTLKSLREVIATHAHTSETCLICILDYECGDKMTILPCNHLFHADCVGIWLREHSQACPLCNAVVSS